MQEVGRQQQDIFYAPHLDAKVNQATLFYLKGKDRKKMYTKQQQQSLGHTIKSRQMQFGRWTV